MGNAILFSSLREVTLSQRSEFVRSLKVLLNVLETPFFHWRILPLFVVLQRLLLPSECQRGGQNLSFLKGDKSYFWL